MKTKILKLTLLLVLVPLLTVVVASCKDQEKNKVCNVKNPLTDLPWLKELVNDKNQSPGIYVNIFQCDYNNGHDGFLIEPCVNCDDYILQLYSCNGTILFNLTGTLEIEAFYQELDIKSKKLIWTNIKHDLHI